MILESGKKMHRVRIIQIMMKELEWNGIGEAKGKNGVRIKAFRVTTRGDCGEGKGSLHVRGMRRSICHQEKMKDVQEGEKGHGMEVRRTRERYHLRMWRVMQLPTWKTILEYAFHAV